MKTVIATLLFGSVAFSAFAQQSPDPENQRRKSFIGITLGPAIPVGQFATRDNRPVTGTGMQINLINFGYLFNDRIGMAAKWYGGANPLKFEARNANLTNEFEPYSYGGIMAGPMVSFPLAERAELDFRALIGYCITQFPKPKNSKITHTSKAALAYSLGINMRFHLSSRFSIPLGVEYFSSSAENKDTRFEQTISTITPTIGLAYRFN